MKAVEANLLPFLQGTQQLRIPIYQRTYSWTRSQVDQLWRDVLRVAQDPAVPSHFIGSIVYIQDREAPMTAIPELLVIDGQQRLTTLTLLIIALRRAITASSASFDVSADELDDYYLRNRHGRGDFRYKLLLTQRDHDTLKALLSGLEPPAHSSPRIVESFRFLQDQMNRPSLDLNAVYRGLQKLTIVDIRLERGTDNPQLIFESLNSTGLDLSQADLVRNFVLMDLKPGEQEDLFTSYWQPMEHRLAQTDGGSLFDRFMRDYLTIQTERIPNIAHVYDVFKAYMRAQGGIPTSAILADIERYSRHFHALASATNSDDQVRRTLHAINQLEVNVAYPFLMQVYDDYSRGVLANPELATILRLVESYVFRRAVCAIPTNTLNKTFAALYREIDPTDYVGSLRRAFARMTSYRRFPTDEEFRAMLQIRDVYNFRSRSYLLRKLETGDHVEPLTAPKITIEHIMPQRVDQSTEWQAMLGPNWQEVHAKYLHTLGNLTLTGYNPELSNKPFLVKRDHKPGGFADSHFHRLNGSLAPLDHWDAATIEARAAELAALAVKVWPGVDDLLPPLTPKTPSGDRASGKPPLGPTQMLLAVFRDPLDIEAAHLLVRNLVDCVDAAGARRLLVVTYRQGRRIGLTLGGWYVLSFRRRQEGLTAGFCFDYGQFPDIESLVPRKIEPFSGRYANGRDIRWVVMPWNHLKPPPEAFLASWRSTVEHAARTFKDWQAAQVAGAHDQSLLDAFLDEGLVARLLQGAEQRTEAYTLDHHLAPLPPDTRSLFDVLRRRILALSPAIREEPKKLYVAYKMSTNFVDITPRRKDLVLTLNMPFSAINDPKGLCRDVSDIGHWGNGDVEVTVDSSAQMDDVMALIRQSFERHS